MVAVSALALALTAPGQTAAISAFIDPMTADLGISRSAISTAYLVGTLVGAGAMPLVGRALDRLGTRRTMALVGLVFGGVLLALSFVSGLVGLTAGFVGVRMAGQGALGLTATTAVAVWFTRRRGTAVGLVSAVGAAGISLAPIGLEALIGAHGWRTAWVVEGLVVWALVVPLALFGVRNSPADLGQQPDGRRSSQGPVAAPPRGRTLAQASRVSLFWVVITAVGVSGMLSTAVAFHQIDLLGARGLSSTEAAANFLPQTAAALLATLAVGALIDRVDPRWVTAVCMGPARRWSADGHRGRAGVVGPRVRRADRRFGRRGAHRGGRRLPALLRHHPPRRHPRRGRRGQRRLDRTRPGGVRPGARRHRGVRRRAGRLRRAAAGGRGGGPAVAGPPAAGGGVRRAGRRAAGGAGDGAGDAAGVTKAALSTLT
ncbi:MULTISPECIES: MFS transporter [unclassified Modestobacter]